MGYPSVEECLRASIADYVRSETVSRACCSRGYSSMTAEERDAAMREAYEEVVGDLSDYHATYSDVLAGLTGVARTC